MNYEIKHKRANGKWWGFGRIQKNKWDNLQLSMKVTPELIELVTSKQGEWLNFSLFEPREQSEEHVVAETKKIMGGNDFIDDEIVF